MKTFRMLVLALATLVILATRAGGLVAWNDTGPAGVPKVDRIKSITLACRNGKGKEVLKNREQFKDFVESLSSVFFLNTEKVAGPTSITFLLKDGEKVQPEAYLNGRVVFGTRHYKLGQRWLDRPFCGR